MTQRLPTSTASTTRPSMTFLATQPLGLLRIAR
jgi:hypothetical protein